MWFFRSPTIVFGEDALLHIREIGDRSAGERAFVITDQAIQKSGQLATVLFQLEHAGMQTHVFDEVETELTLSHIKTATKAMDAFNPSWIVAVGGNHIIDAAKAMWILLENPDADLLSLNAMEPIQMGGRAGMIAIPTPDGVGSATTWAITLVDENAETDEPAAAINTGHPFAMPTYAVIDPTLAATLTPAQIADAGILALVQAIEGYASTWQNDFTEGLCLVATKLVFNHLPRAFQDTSDIEAIEKISNSAGIAGLGYINSMVGAAYLMGRALHMAFPVLTLGHAVGVCLPAIIAFNASPDRPEDVETHYAELARFLSLPSDDESTAATALAKAVHTLLGEVDMPHTLAEAGITREQLDEAMDDLMDQVLSDTILFTAPRQPSEDELRQLFGAVFENTAEDAPLDA